MANERPAQARPYEVSDDDPPALQMVLCCTACQHGWQPAATSWDELSSMGCPGCGGWAWIEELAGPRPWDRGRPVSEYRMSMVGVAGLCALAAASGVWPAAGAASTVVVAGLGGVGVVVAVVVASRRELRIRGRLAAIQPRPTADAVSLVRAGRAS